MPRPSLNIRFIQNRVVLASSCSSFSPSSHVRLEAVEVLVLLIKNSDRGIILKKEDRKENHCHDNHATGEVLAFGDV